jgi:hypothetical protein
VPAVQRTDSRNDCPLLIVVGGKYNATGTDDAAACSSETSTLIDCATVVSAAPPPVYSLTSAELVAFSRNIADTPTTWIEEHHDGTVSRIPDSITDAVVMLVLFAALIGLP